MLITVKKTFSKKFKKSIDAIICVWYYRVKKGDARNCDTPTHKII